MKSSWRTWFLLLAGSTTGACLAGEPAWPQWRGPRRDDVSTETGLLKQWPADGPRLIWTATGCGKGYSSVAVAGPLLYTAGTADRQTHVLAFDLAGKLTWKAPNGPSWKASPEMKWALSYDGARATPTVADGLVFHLNDTGQLSAFDAGSGQTVWSVDILQRFEATCPDYGYTESVLVDGDRLICYPGGKKGYMVALDKSTGATVWANTEIGDGAGFSSAILVEDQGLRQIVHLTAGNLIGVDAATGKLLWRHPFTNKRQNNIPTLIYQQGHLFATTGYGGGSVLLKLAVAGGGVAVSQVWANTELDNIHGGVVLLDGCIYGTSNEKPGWMCLDLMTGQVRCRDKSAGMGSVTSADGRLYFLGERGSMALLACTPEKYTSVSRFEVPKGGEGLFWAHPVVCGGRLYIRHADRLYAYDIAAR